MIHRFEDAIADAKKSVEADPSYSRGYERLATAQLVAICIAFGSPLLMVS